MDSNEDLKELQEQSVRDRAQKMDIMVAWMAAALARTSPTKMDEFAWARAANDYALDKMKREKREAAGMATEQPLTPRSDSQRGRV